MTEQQLREQLSILVSQYDDPEKIFISAVDELMAMYQLRHNENKLVEYMLSIEYAPDSEMAADLAVELKTPESFIFELDWHLHMLLDYGLIVAKEVSKWPLYKYLLQLFKSVTLNQYEFL